MPLIVIVLLPGGVTGLTLKPTFIPGAVPLVVNDTGSVKERMLPTLTVYWASLGAQTATLGGVSASVKSGFNAQFVQTRAKSWSVGSPLLGTPSPLRAVAATVMSMLPLDGAWM